MGTIQVLFDRWQGPPHSGKGFALGLVIIGLFAALLILPVSRIITNRPRNSANRPCRSPRETFPIGPISGARMRSVTWRRPLIEWPTNWKP